MGYQMMNFGALSENGEGLCAGAALEHKFARFGTVAEVEGGLEISGYASLFGAVDQGGHPEQCCQGAGSGRPD